MRIESSVKNIKTGWLMYGLRFLSQFISRTVIIMTLSVEYVGLSGLFSNVLMMLSLAELGIGEAIVFSLYGPIGHGEVDKVKSIMKLYRKVYICIGCFIIVAGLCMAPFIDCLIKGVPNIPNIHLIFFLYVLNSAISYFFSYKATFIKANQKNFIVVINSEIFNFCAIIISSIALIITHNYVFFMSIQIVIGLLANININRIANKRYPYLKEKNVGKTPREIFNQIKKNTLAMVFHKIGGIIVFATDNIIISKFLGLVSVGLYSNYYTITAALMSFANQFFVGISASVGNLAVEDSIEKQEETFFNIMFINFWMYTFIECGLFTMLNTFVGDIWLGREYTLGYTLLFLMIFKEYITGMRQSVLTFKNAKGIYWQNKFMPIYESIINLVVSLMLVKFIGIAGVIIGTIISSLTTCVWIEPYVLYKYGFEKKATAYVKKYLQYMFVFFITIAVSFICCKGIGLLFFEIFNISGAYEIRSLGVIITFIAKLITVILISNGLLWLIYRNSKEYKYLLNIIKTKLFNLR